MIFFILCGVLRICLVSGTFDGPLSQTYSKQSPQTDSQVHGDSSATAIGTSSAQYRGERLDSASWVTVHLTMIFSGGESAVQVSQARISPRNQISASQPTLQSSQGSTLDTNGEKQGWGRVKVSPEAFISAVYKDLFRVSIYRREKIDNDPLLQQYYYSPALILDTSSGRCEFSDFNRRFEMSFSVLMWDREFEKFVRDTIADRLNATVHPASVRILPIEEIRIASIGRNMDYELFDKWTSYASQPANFVFRFLTLTDGSCKKIAKLMEDHPQDFVNNLIVYYNMQTIKTSKSSLEIRAEHIKGGGLTSTLLQKMEGKDPVFMNADDAKNLTMEMATSVIANQAQDDDFISSDQALQLSTLMESILKMVPQSTADFDAQMWNSVYWNDDNARPDKTTQTLNDIFSKYDGKTQEITHDAQSSDLDVKYKAEGDIAGLASMKVDVGVKYSQDSQKDRDFLKHIVQENKDVSQWNGEKFEPKPMNLKRVNTAAFRSSTTIATTQVRVSKSTSELTSRLNLLDIRSISELNKQRNEMLELKTEVKLMRLEQTAQAKHHVPPGTIAAFATGRVPEGYLQCNGSSYDVGRYPVLYQILGTDKTPDLTNRVPRGAASSGSIGQSGGNDMITIARNQAPLPSVLGIRNVVFRSLAFDDYQAYKEEYVKGKGQWEVAGYKSDPLYGAKPQVEVLTWTNAGKISTTFIPLSSELDYNENTTPAKVNITPQHLQVTFLIKAT